MQIGNGEAVRMSFINIFLFIHQLALADPSGEYIRKYLPQLVRSSLPIPLYSPLYHLLVC